MNRIFIILFSISFIFSERGDLISFQYESSMLIDDIQLDLNNTFNELAPAALYSIKLYSIVYETIDQFGNYTEASGLICYPDNIFEAFPILSFQHGTQIRRNSAPSMNGFNDLVKWIGTSGYIFIEPDYIGLGISQLPHPYHLKDVTASSVIDMIRATKYFCDELSDIQYNDQLYLSGYSEGGYATMATVKEIEENLNHEIDITVSFPMAGAYDLSGVMVDLMLSEEIYADPFYLPYLVLSYIDKYDLGNIEDLFYPEYASILPDLFSGEYSGGYINSFLPDIPIHMMLESVVYDFSQNDIYPFRLALEENNLYDWTPQNPMYMFHGIADERVPHENSVVAYNNFVENGSESVYFESLPESYGGHQDAAVYCLLIAFDISESMKNIYSKGDLNLDTINNIQDIVMIVEVIFEGIEITSYLNWAADLNIDNQNNILDAVILVGDVLSE